MVHMSNLSYTYKQMWYSIVSLCFNQSVPRGPNAFVLAEKKTWNVKGLTIKIISTYI